MLKRSKVITDTPFDEAKRAWQSECNNCFGCKSNKTAKQTKNIETLVSNTSKWNETGDISKSSYF